MKEPWRGNSSSLLLIIIVIDTFICIAGKLTTEIKFQRLVNQLTVKIFLSSKKRLVNLLDNFFPVFLSENMYPILRM